MKVASSLPQSSVKANPWIRPGKRVAMLPMTHRTALGFEHGANRRLPSPRTPNDAADTAQGQRGKDADPAECQNYVLHDTFSFLAR